MAQVRNKIEYLESTDISGVFLSLMPDERHAKLATGAPLAVRVTFQRERAYFTIGKRVNTAEYADLLSARKSRADKKELLDFFSTIERAVKNVRMANDGVFSMELLNDKLKKKEDTPTTDDVFEYWSQFTSRKTKEKTVEMYRNSCAKFRMFATAKKLFDRKGNLSIRKITTATISEFDTWLSEQTRTTKSGDVKPLSLDSRMIFMRAARAVFNGAVEDGLIAQAPKFKIHTGNRRRDNALHVDEILKLWEYWKALDDTEKVSAKGRGVGRWLLLYCLNGANLVDVAKLKWTEKSSTDEKYPQFSFVRSKIDRANKPIGKELTATIIPIIPQLRELLNVYASPYKVGSCVFPDIFLNAKNEKEQVSRLHDFGRNITRDIMPVCATLGIPRITPQYARNSFISALAHHGVLTAYIDFAVGHSTSDVSALLAGYISNISDEAMDAYNRKLFIVPPIPQI